MTDKRLDKEQTLGRIRVRCRWICWSCPDDEKGVKVRVTPPPRHCSSLPPSSRFFPAFSHTPTITNTPVSSLAPRSPPQLSSVTHTQKHAYTQIPVSQTSTSLSLSLALSLSLSHTHTHTHTHSLPSQLPMHLGWQLSSPW